MFAFVRRNGVHIGISGWNYPGWRGVFYPAGLPHKQELAFASRSFDSIEVNGSFYSLLRPDSVKRWREQTPSDFRDPAFFDLLQRHRVALCIADTAKRYPDFDEVTADFVYVRLHGATKLYVSGYGRRTLERWAARIDRWREGPKKREVFVYFDNDAKVRAPFDARTLMNLVHGPAQGIAKRHSASSLTLAPNEPFRVAAH